MTVGFLYALSSGLGTSEHRLSGLFFLSTGLVPRLFLLLIRQGGQSGRDLPNLNIPQWVGEFLSVGLDESSIQRFVLMPLDDELEDLTRESDKIFFGLWVSVQDRPDVHLRAYRIQR